MHTIRTWWTSLSSKSQWGIIGGITAFALATNIIGFQVGRSHSPDYNSESSALIFIVTHSWATELSHTNVELKTRAGNWIYRYRFETDELERILIPASELAAKPMPRRNAHDELVDYIELVGIASAIPGGAIGAIKLFGRSVKTTKKYSKAFPVSAGIMIAFSAGWVGYLWGYDDTQDYEAKLFQSTINNKNVWRDFASQYVCCQALKALSKKDGERCTAQVENTQCNKEYCQKLEKWSLRYPYLDITNDPLYILFEYLK